MGAGLVQRSHRSPGDKEEPVTLTRFLLDACFLLDLSPALPSAICWHLRSDPPEVEPERGLPEQAVTEGGLSGGGG